MNIRNANMRSRLARPLQVLSYLLVGLQAHAQTSSPNPYELSERSKDAALRRKNAVAFIEAERILPGDPTKTGSKLYAQTVDRGGNVTDLKSYSREGKISTHIVYSYDLEGRLTEKIDSFFSSKPDTMRTVYLYTYKETELRPSTETVRSKLSGEKPGAWTYAYDSLGRLSEGTLSGTGVSTRRENWRFVYDASGNISEELYKVESSATKRTFKYNAAGQITEMINYMNDKPGSATLYTYDAQGRKRERIMQYPAGTMTSKTIYTYQANGLPEKEETYNAKGEMTSGVRYVYTYYR